MINKDHMMRQPGGDTARPRSVVAGRRHPLSEFRAAARRSYPASEASGGREETPRIRDQGRPGEATSRPRPGAVTLRSHPEPEARAGGQEEQPEEWWLRSTGGPRGAILVQGKEQLLCFAGAEVKRYPTPR